MPTEQDLSQLLQEKINLFTQYEQATSAMDVCPVDDLEQYAKARQSLAGQIDPVDAKITACVAHDPQADQWRSVVAGRHVDPMPKGADAILELAQTLFAILYRIQKMEPQVMERIRLEQDRLMEKIKSTNQSLSAQASKFYGSTGGYSSGSMGKFGKA